MFWLMCKIVWDCKLLWKEKTPLRIHSESQYNTRASLWFSQCDSLSLWCFVLIGGWTLGCFSKDTLFFFKVSFEKHPNERTIPSSSISSFHIYVFTCKAKKLQELLSLPYVGIYYKVASAKTYFLVSLKFNYLNPQAK